MSRAEEEMCSLLSFSGAESAPPQAGWTWDAGQSEPSARGLPGSPGASQVPFSAFSGCLRDLQQPCERVWGADSASAASFRPPGAFLHVEPSERAFPRVPCSWGSAYELGAVQYFYVGEIRGRSSVETSFSSSLGCFCCRVTSWRWRPPSSSICVRFLEVSGRFRQLRCRRWRHFALQCWWRSGGFPILLRS